MSIPVILQGTLTSDGTLQLDEKVNLPAGRVRVMVQPVSTAPDAPEQFHERMQAIWAVRKSGMPTPAAHRLSLREEMEQEIQEAMQLQERCRAARQTREPSP